MDSALDDFLARFGDPDPNKPMVQNQKRIPVSLATEGTGFKASGLTSLATTGLQQTELPSKLNLSTDSDDEQESFGDKASDIGLKALSAAPSAISLINNAKGGQFDTSADGGGPGKAGGAILQGAVQGQQLASNLGFKDPLTQGLFALGGGVVSTLGHKKAMKEWRRNQVKQNLSENALEIAKNEEEYAMEQGLASLKNLKSLREKQLGIIS